MKEFSINKINESVKGDLVGPKDTKIRGLALVNLAKTNELTLIGNKKYIADLVKSEASAVIVDKSLKELINIKDNVTYLFVDNADLAMAKALHLFSKEAPQHKTIHPSAIIDENVSFGDNVTVGPNSYIGKNCVIGDNTVIYANVSIYDDCKIGANTIIWSASVIRENTIIGDHCHLSANCSIGNEGFGYLPDENGDGLYRIPHIGNVVIGNHVDIGANSCVDKGKFSSTIIGDYSKIDNLVQIGHNCIIGKRVVVCGAAGISGSVTIGDGATIAGGAGIKDHIHIGKNAVVAARAGVIQDVPDGETHAGFPADLYKNTMRQWLAIRHLPQTIKTVKQLVKKSEETK